MRFREQFVILGFKLTVNCTDWFLSAQHNLDMDEKKKKYQLRNCCLRLAHGQVCGTFF